MGINCNLYDKHGFTPLHLACIHGSLEIVQLLLTYGAKTDCADKYGLLPIHLACGEGFVEIAKLLVRNGNFLDMKCTANLATPLFYACFNQKTDMVTWLVSQRADPNLTMKNGNNSFHTACQRGFFEIAQILAAHGASINMSSNDAVSLSALHFACINRRLEIVTWLLSNKANVDATTNDGVTPLSLACEKEYLDIAEVLVRHGAVIDRMDEKFPTTLLSMACFSNKGTVVNWLLAHKADPNIINLDGHTPFHMACVSGFVEIAKVLVQHGALLDIPTRSNKLTPLHLATLHKRLNVVNWLLSQQVNVDVAASQEYTPLLIACQKGYIEIAQTLVDHGADINIKTKEWQFTPLFVACVHERTDIVAWLLSQNVNANTINKEGFAPLHMACRDGFIDITKLLIDHGALIDIPSQDELLTPLYIACVRKRTKIIKYLLSKRANIDAKNKGGFTAIYVACQEGHIKIAKLLAKHGASIDLPSVNAYCTPLHVACSRGKYDIVEWLLSQSANVNATDINGFSPFHMACQYGCTKTAQLLMGKGVLVNQVGGKLKCTPLHVACIHGRLDVAKVLVTHSANVNMVALNNYSALDYACEAGSLEIVQWLLTDLRPKLECKLGHSVSFHIACTHGNVAIVKYLLSLDPSLVSSVDTNGNTPISLAFLFRNKDGCIDEKLMSTFIDPEYYTRITEQDQLLLDNHFQFSVQIAKGWKKSIPEMIKKIIHIFDLFADHLKPYLTKRCYGHKFILWRDLFLALGYFLNHNEPKSPTKAPARFDQIFQIIIKPAIENNYLKAEMFEQVLEIFNLSSQNDQEKFEKYFTLLATNYDFMLGEYMKAGGLLQFAEFFLNPNAKMS